MRQNEAQELLHSQYVGVGHLSGRDPFDRSTHFGRYQAQQSHITAPVGLLVGHDGGSRPLGEATDSIPPGKTSELSR